MWTPEDWDQILCHYYSRDFNYLDYLWSRIATPQTSLEFSAPRKPSVETLPSKTTTMTSHCTIKTPAWTATTASPSITSATPGTSSVLYFGRHQDYIHNYKSVGMYLHHYLHRLVHKNKVYATIPRVSMLRTMLMDARRDSPAFAWTTTRYSV